MACDVVHLLQEARPTDDFFRQEDELIPLRVACQRTLGQGTQISDLDGLAPEPALQLVEVLQHRTGQLLVILELQRIAGTYNIVDVLPAEPVVLHARAPVAVQGAHELRPLQDFPGQPDVLIHARIARQRSFRHVAQTLPRHVARVSRVRECLEFIQQLLGQLLMAAL